LLSLIASPKHPQSDTALVIARYKVRGKKNAINIREPHIAYLGFKFTNNEKPMINSAAGINIARTKAKGIKISQLNAIK